MFKSDPKFEGLVLSAICLLVALGALGVTAWTLVTKQVGEQGLDALFLIAVCLFIAVTFGSIPLRTFRRVGFRRHLKRSHASGEAADGESSRAQTSA